MNKDAYYFPHFSNARHDNKIRRAIKELGAEGYAIYFMLLEVLRDKKDFKYPMADIDLLADEFNSSEQKVKTVVCNYSLFNIDNEDNFFSLKFNEYLQPYIQKKLQGKKAAEIRWEKHYINQHVNTDALQGHSDSNAGAIQVKETKVKETKVKETKEEVPEHLCDVFPKYLEMRKLIKKPITENGKQLLFKKLSAMGDNQTQIAILEQSIMNAWQGVFPLKKEIGSNVSLNQLSSRNDPNSEENRQYKEKLGW